MANCRACGATLLAGAPFCSTCGTRSIPIEPAAPSAAPSMPSSMASPYGQLPYGGAHRGPRPLGVTILAVLEIVGGALAALVGIVMAATGAFVGSLGSTLAPTSPSGLSGGTLGAIVAVVGVFVMVIGGLAAYLGYGLWQGKGWAWTIVFALQVVGLVVGLITLPLSLLGPAAAFSMIVGVIGLLFNGFIVWYLWQPGVRRWFGKLPQQAALPGYVPPLPPPS